jgi:hypothetical protein
MVRTGRFRPLPLLGARVVPFGIAGLAFAAPQQALLGAALMLIIGTGIGLQFPTALVAVQSAVPRRDVGVATATAAFSRSLGAAISVAVLTAMLLSSLQSAAPQVAGALSGGELMKDLVGGALAHIGGEDRVRLVAAAAQSFNHLFKIAAAVSLVSLLMAWRLPDTTLAGPGAQK